MHRGYYKMWRKAEESLVFEHKDPNLWKLWSYCLFRANYKKSEVVVGSTVITLEPGQFITGRKRLSEKLHLSERQIRTLLKILENSKNVTIKTTNKFSVITVENWGIYQQQESINDQQNDQQVTSKRPASDQQVTTEKKVKKESIKEGKNKRRTVPPYDPEFLRFWEAYPPHRRTDKQAAFRAWMGMNGDRPPIEVVMMSLEEWSGSDDWNRENGKFVPGARKFIEGRYWEAEPKRVARYSDTTRANVLAAMEVMKERGLQ